MRRLKSLLLLGVMVLDGAACSSGTGGSCTMDAHCLDAASSDTHADGHDGSLDAPGSRTLVSVTLAPANPTLITAIGTPASVTITATGHYSDGRAAPVSGTYSVPDGAIGAIDPVSGVYTATGAAGGVVPVHFTASSGGGGTADTTVTVSLFQNVAPAAGMPGSDAIARFLAAPPAVTDVSAQASILYPLNRVLFPQNINAPLVQWQQTPAGATGDLYRLTFAKPHILVTQYVAFTPGFTFSAALPDAVFSRIAETDPTADATLAIDRLDASTNRVISGPPITMRFATGSVSGTVYYWQMTAAALHRIPAGTTNDVHLFPSGIVNDAASPSYSYGGCIACHQISRDGRYLLANGDAGYVFDLSAVDPTGAMVPVRVQPGFRWYFSSMSPDNTRIFATMGDATAQYLSATTLQPVAFTGMPLSSSGFAHPYWSPDGTRVAVISNVTGWTGNAAFTGGDLTLLNVNTTTDTISTPSVIHHGADLTSTDPAGGTADCFPSWTPDSKFIVFAHTANTRATGADGRTFGSLYLIRPPDATHPMAAAPARMALASDDEMSLPRAHYPNLSPIVSGGYYWLVYYSDRFYGNAQVGTLGSRHPQLWVTAIATNWDGTSDPSSVPYWLPGQDVAQSNADAVWAAAACRTSGTTCATSSDCCSGTCVPDGTGAFHCGAPPTCRREGESCEHTSDCCGTGTLTCDPVTHVCEQPIG